MPQFQENLKQIRIEKGFKTAKDFAAMLDIPYTTYINWENKGREPDFETLCKIADALHVTTDELLGHVSPSLIENKILPLLRKSHKYSIGQYDKEIINIRVIYNPDNILFQAFPGEKEFSFDFPSQFLIFAYEKSLTNCESDILASMESYLENCTAHRTLALLKKKIEQNSFENLLEEILPERSPEHE